MHNRSLGGIVAVTNRLLGSRAVSFGASRIVPGLRILAYHDVTDRAALGDHLDLLRSAYRPVSAEEVVAAVSGDVRLPRRSVWVTFDDGSPDALATSRMLAESGIRATAFVCPGLVDTDEPFWWQIVDRALAAGYPPPSTADGAAFRKSLKLLPDALRRDQVQRCRVWLATNAAEPFQVGQLTQADLRSWVAEGHHVGNHTWDHPLLDQCSPEEQRAQVERAHSWLLEHCPGQPRVFAYPNGNRTKEAEKFAIAAGYTVRVLFDHRVARRTADGGDLSRLRLDADAPLSRARAVVSGGHSTAFRLLRNA